MLIGLATQHSFGQPHIHGGHSRWQHGVRSAGGTRCQKRSHEADGAAVVTLVYLDSFFFIVVSSVSRFGLANVQMTASRCKITDIVCLTVYLSTKVCRSCHFSTAHSPQDVIIC